MADRPMSLNAPIYDEIGTAQAVEKENGHSTEAGG